MRRSSIKPQDSLRCQARFHACKQSTDTNERRTDRLTELLANAPAIENGLAVPDVPARYVALEQSIFGDTLWAFFDNFMTGIMQQLEGSNTSFVERVRVYDLDTGLIYAPKWTIASLCEVPS